MGCRECEYKRPAGEDGGESGVRGGAGSGVLIWSGRGLRGRWDKCLTLSACVCVD